MPENLTPNVYRRDIPASTDPNHVWVELGPLYAGGFSKYPFPTRKAAERFAANARERHPRREVRVLW